MPLYEYACKDCGARFETRQSFSDAPLTVCPTCNGSVKRVIHAAGIVFKGSGWYITDSRPTTSSDTTATTDTKTAEPAADATSATPKVETTSKSDSPVASSAAA